MGRHPCRVINGVKKGTWSSEEDELLKHHVKVHGERKWSALAQTAGLNRSGKSCRLRWLNYLRPGIKRGDFAEDEDELILKLHRLLGNRWALIAGRLPGRTDNEVKNYWNTILTKKLQSQTSHSGLSSTTQFQAEDNNALQDFSWNKLQQIPGPAKAVNDNVRTDGNVIGLGNDVQSSIPSTQIDQGASMDFSISDSLQENENGTASDQLENAVKIKAPLLDIKKIAFLLDIYENELRELI